MSKCDCVFEIWQTKVLYHFRYFHSSFPEQLQKWITLFIYEMAFMVLIVLKEIAVSKWLKGSILYEDNAEISKDTVHFAIFLIFVGQGVENCVYPWL